MSKKKVAIIGVDGFSYNLINNYIKNDIFSDLSKILRNGFFTNMKVTIPEISNVSWTTFFTGNNPAEHNIQGFVDLKPNSYEIFFPTFVDNKGECIWDDLEKYNKKTYALNIPGTYPAHKINGILISGFVAIELEKSVYPQFLIPTLQDFNYMLDVDTKDAQNKLISFLDEIRYSIEIRKKTYNYLWEKDDWDLFIGVLTETDRLNHFLFDAAFDSSNEYHNKFIEIYQMVEDFISFFYNKCDENTEFIILSDHGFTKIKQEFYINNWLKDKGYLLLNTKNMFELDKISSDSKAFALDPTRIFIHLKDKYPKGTIDSSQKNKILNEIKNELLEIEYNGEKIIKQVYFKDEIFEGTYADRSPDLVYITNPGFDSKGRMIADSIFGKTHLQGMHVRDDAVFFTTNKNLTLENNYIGEIKSKILNYLL